MVHIHQLQALRKQRAQSSKKAQHMRISSDISAPVETTTCAVIIFKHNLN